MFRGQGATWNFPGIEDVMTNPSQVQRDRYSRWHMTALIFGTWPDGEPILGPGDVGIGECRHFRENKIESECNLSSIHFSNIGNHFGHFHVEPRRGNGSR